MAIKTKIIVQQLLNIDDNITTASKYPKYTVVLANSISSITAGELTSAVEASAASAAAAKQSEINAKASENGAAISAAASQQSATKAAYSATNSANSAEAAKTSETNAKASEVAAKTSETNSKNSETASAQSATNSANSAEAALDSKNAAKTSETNSKTSETNAKNSETNASSSQTDAANSKTAAAASAQAAADSATAAAGSATNSLNSATNASNFAADASASATVAINALMNSTFEPSDFDFTTGGTLDATDRNKAVYNPADNNWYSWTGTLPLVVVAGTDPLDDSNWTPRTDELLRDEIGSSEGLKYIGFCNSLDEMQAVIPDKINQKISLLGVSSGDVAGGGEFISVNATDYPADNQGVCFTSANPSFNWYRLKTLQEKIIYLEDFGCVESTPGSLVDCTTQLKNAFTWATAQANGVYKIKSRGNFYKVSGSLGVVDFGFTEIAFDSPVTIYAPDSASITEKYTVFEFKMTQRNSAEQSYQSRSMVGDNLNVKGTNRRTSLVTAYYIHDMWGSNLGISYHGVGTGIVFGSNVWCIGVRGLLSAQLCISNERAESTAGENICIMPGSILYNSGQLMDLTHYQFFVNMFGTSLDYTPGQPDRPALDVGNSVVNHIGGHTEYAGPSYSAFVRVNGDFGGCHIIGGELLLVVDSSTHYAYFAETKQDYQFSIRDTAVFGTRMVGTALCNRKMRYAPTVNYGSTQNISRISDNGGNVLYDPTFSTGAIKDKWHVVGGTQTDRFTTTNISIGVAAYASAASGYALKVNKLVTGSGNSAAVRLEVKAKNVFLSPRISFKIVSLVDVAGEVIVNLNPALAVIRDAYGMATGTGRVMTSLTTRSTSFSSMVANTPVTVTLNTVEMVSADNISPDIYLLDIGLQNLPIGTYYIYDVNYCQGDA